MADYLNITRPSLSRELGKMQEEGILELSRRQILVKDQEKLEILSLSVTYVTEYFRWFLYDMAVKQITVITHMEIRER